MAKGNYTGLAMLILSVHLSLIHPSFHSSVYLFIYLSTTQFQYMLYLSTVLQNTCV